MVWDSENLKLQKLYDSRHLFKDLRYY